MKKIEVLKLDLSARQKSQQAIFCPFTGGLLVSADPFMEIEEYPESVLAVYLADFFEEPHYLRKDLKNSNFQDFEDLDDLELSLAKLDFKSSGCLILAIMNYGTFPGDAGGFIFVLEIPNPIIL
jgi:hypothetical protein